MSESLKLFLLLLPLIVLVFGGFVYLLARQPPKKLEPGE